MFLIPIFLAVLLGPPEPAPPFDVKGDYTAMAKKHCAIEWPDDFSMQNYCLRLQRNGMLEFRRSHEEFGKVIEKAIEKCVEDWTKDRVPDWSMIGYCSRQQADSLRRRSY